MASSGVSARLELRESRGCPRHWRGSDLFFPGSVSAGVEARLLRLEIGVKMDSSPLLPSFFQSG